MTLQLARFRWTALKIFFSLLYFHLNSAKFERKTENILGVTECLSYIFRQKAKTFVLIINMKMIQDSAGFMFEAEK